MSRVLFVMGIAGGVGVAYLQYGGAQRKSNGASRNVLNSSLMRAASCEQARRYFKREQHNRAGHSGEKLVGGPG
jgi:hypothetical protein